MKLNSLLTALVLWCWSYSSCAFAAAGADGFESLFDGRTLKGWMGQDMSFWSVEEGAIMGTISPEHVPKLNQYLVWQGGVVDDFELKLRVRLRSTSSPGVNSGFQVRSPRLPN